MRFAKPFLAAILTLAFLVHPVLILSQNNPENSAIKIRPAGSSLKIDGHLDEVAWQRAEKAHQFYQIFPTDSTGAISATEVMLTYDQEYLYIGAICHDTLRQDHVITSLKRDFDWGQNDNFSIYIDPFNDRTNGFTFGISPFGIQREGLISGGEEVSTDWDNKWFSAVQSHDDRWTLEMAIPFKSLRYNPQNLTWNINFLRNNQKQNERTSWIQVPQQYRPSSLAFSGKLLWEKVPDNKGPNIVLIPFVSTSITKDHEAGESTNYNFDAGLDAKVAITSSLNLDLTINPDFSQVEVDDQVTNLDRFEIFFPEKRQFFLENSDLFAQSGFSSARPFFSRRIGIAEDSAENNLLVPIRYGMRLSGKINRNWRLGILNMQTAEDKENFLNAQNYTVATFQRQVFARSNVGGIFVNRQALNFQSSDSITGTRYNRVFGVDYNLISANNRWEGHSFYHRSDDPGRDNKDFSHGLFLRYASRNLRVFWVQQAIGENYQADVGFIRRTGIRRGNLNLQGSFYPKNPKIVTHQSEIEVEMVTDSEYNLIDRQITLEHEISFTNRSEIELQLERNLTRLIDPFDPSGSEGLELAKGTTHRWWSGSIEYRTDPRKRLNQEFGGSYGGFFNGNRFAVSWEMNYRYQPYGGVSMNFTYNRIRLPRPFNDSDFLLIGPKIDLTFTDKLFLTTFVQYNNQQDNININSRFQWRYAPISDLFIVYTDNYFPDTFRVKNRALVLKFSYWLNV